MGKRSGKSHRVTGTHEDGMEKWTEWGEGQVELFDILRKICVGAGEEGASGILESIKRGDGHQKGERTFVEELAEMRDRAARVEGLERDVIALKEELRKVREELVERSTPEISLKPGSFGGLGNQGAGTPRSTSKPTIPAPSAEYSGRSDGAYESLVVKHNTLVTNHKELMAARKELEDKLRARKESTTEWVNYANSLEKRIERLQNLWALRATLSDVTQPHLVSSNPPGNVGHGPSAAVNVNGLVPATTHVSEEFEESSGFHSIVSHTPLVSGQDAEPSRVHSLVSSGLPEDSDAQASQLNSSSSAILLNLVTEELISLQKRQGHSLSSDSHLPNSTEERAAVDSLPMNNHQQHTTVPLVAGSSSDTPIVVSSRTVRKRNAQADETPRQSTRVKLEILTSSPIGLAALHSLRGHDSLDLDEIGEKYDTPKKKRRDLRTGAVHTEQHQSYTGIIGSPSALQLASPNNRMLPKAFGKGHQTKRQRLEDGRVLIPTRSSEDSAVEPRNGRGYGNQKRLLRPSASAEYQRSFATVSTPLKRPRNGKTSDRKARTSKKQDNEVFDDSLSLRGNGQDYQSFRATPVLQLGLKHFKVNPSYNQGYDYAFTDVVRGRDQRKCLPGCTKPDCCGDKFRKIVELTSKRQGKQTRSQEEENEKLLEEYMGDNHRRLRTMTKSERDELLIQARARELAQRAGKHRHAYERRRSPPGFWRTDFPTTQEVQADRAEAARVERELVQQRYEEAMRPGGRWMFRDELV